MMTTQVMNDVQAVADVAEKIKSDERQQFPAAASVGDFVRQGDVYITLLGGIPKGSTVEKQPSRQLAPGNTQGSRHCLSSLSGVEVYRLKDATPYDGPVLDVSKPVTITHPEHGDWSLPCGVYGISYQRTEDSEGRIRRVQD